MEHYTREIKFRFWDLEKQEMLNHSIDGITQHCLGKSLTTNIHPLITINGDYFIPNFCKSCIAMQFIGMKDEYGVEIFEGDILSSKSGKKFEVIFIDGGFRRKQIEFNYHYTPYCLSEGDIRLHEIKVVGNIYQNPELLSSETNKIN